LPLYHANFAASLRFALPPPGYFDIHPPLGKLILAYVGTVLGYRSDPTFIIKKIGDAYPPTVNFLALRIVSATFSVATIPMMYIVSRTLRFSRVAATLTSVEVLLCFLGTIEGRLILMDSQLFFFCQLTLFSALMLWRTVPGTRRRWVFLATTGVSAGMALCVKHTALATPALIAIVSFFGIHFLAEPLAFPEYMLAGSIAVVTYALPFYPVLTRPWSTGDKYDKFMSGLPSFQKTLIGGDDYDPTARRPSFIRSFLYLNARMVSSNANVKKRHSWESTSMQWITNWRGVLYYTHRLPKPADGERGKRAIIYLIGNPVAIGLVLLAVVTFCCGLIVLVRLRSLPKRKTGRFSLYSVYTGVFLLSGWVCNLAPYVLVDRAAFLYHYMPALFYGYLLTGAIVDMLPPRLRITLTCVLCTALAAAFVYWSPWIYGFYITDGSNKARQLLPRWN
jgi:dolichyl-phosphate-mannose--protein O-mannosyl transferase